MNEMNNIYVSLFTCVKKHKHTAWGCRGCGCIPNAEKVAII